MKLSMKDFRALMENDLTRGPEPKLVGPAPAAPSKDDKLGANDSVMDPHTRVGSKTTSKVEESLDDDSLRKELRDTHPVKEATGSIGEPVLERKLIPISGKQFVAGMKVLGKRGLYLGGNVLETGNFDKLKPALLRMVSKTNTMEEIKYLRADIQATKHMFKHRISLIDRMNDPKLDMSPSEERMVRNGIKHGVTKEACQDYLNWLDTTAATAINERVKEIRAKEKTVNESVLENTYELVLERRLPTISKDQYKAGMKLLWKGGFDVKRINEKGFGPTKDRLLRMVSKMETMEEVKYLRTDLQTTKHMFRHYVGLIDRMNDPKLDMSPSEQKYVQNKIKHGMTKEACQEYLKWLDDELAPKINEKAKEIRAKERSVHESVWDPEPTVGDIGCNHDFATEKLPVDKTGYPTTPGPTLVDRAGIGAVIAAESVLNEKYTKAPIFITSDLNGIVESVLNLTDDKIIPIAESFSYRYREQLLDRSKYPDIPILEAMDAIFALAECECDDPEIKEKIAECEDATIKKMNQVTTECGFCPNQRNLDELTPMDPGMRVNTYPMYPPEAGVRSTAKFLGNLEAAQTFEEITECMINLTRMTMESSAYYKVTTEGTLVVTEGIGAAAREASRKVANGTRGVLRKGKNAADSVKATVKHATDPMVKFMEETRDKIKKADSAERREIILRGGSIQKVLRWLKRAIPISVGLAVGQVIPVAAVISAIAFIGWIATDKALDQRERQKILKELEDEIEMVNEKIDDARGDSNKQKKYELMRIRNKLNRTHDNIKFNLGSKTFGRDSEAEETMKTISAKKENKK